jgi:hypothetical protein
MAFASIAASCRDTAPTAGVPVPAIAPFEGLAGLRLPTTIGDIARAREQAGPEPFGLSERAGAVTIDYYAQHPPGNSEAPVLPKTPVKRIAADWGAISDDSAETVWRTSLQQLSTALAQPPECHRHSLSVVFAIWHTQNSLAYVRRQHSLTGPIAQSASVLIGFSVDTTVLHGVLPDALPTSCANPYGV